MEDGFPEDMYTFSTLKDLFQATATLGPVIERVLEKLLPITCVISDITMTVAHKVAVQLGLPSVGFSCLGLLNLSAKYYTPRLLDEGLLPLQLHSADGVPQEVIRSLHRTPTAEEAAAYAQKVTCIPGMYPIQLGEFHLPLVTSHCDHSNFLFHHFVVDQIECIVQNRAWMLANSFYELEAAIVDPMQRDMGVKLSTIGPLVVPPTTCDGSFNVSDIAESRKGSLWPPEETKCIQWLDKQNPQSVIYVSFGSLMHVKPEILQDFLLGLEDSGVPFLLVLRSNVVNTEGSEAGSGVDHNVDPILPSGFPERTKEKGLIVSWAPQISVLRHPATAGFLSHCGWNSILESISFGVPMLCYPFTTDQPMNARYAVSVWKVGLEFQRRPDGSVERHEVATKVRALVTEEGTQCRLEAMRWSGIARKAVEKGGSSYNHMAAFVADMHSRAQEAAFAKEKCQGESATICRT
jgi:hypothetical protein